MKEFNKPEPEPVIEKPKKVRKYISLHEEEIHELANIYRKCLKHETDSAFKEMLTEKIGELERELRFRSKLPKTSSSHQ